MCIYKLFKCPSHGDVHWYNVAPCDSVKAGMACPSPVQVGGPTPIGYMLCRNCGGTWWVFYFLERRDRSSINYLLAWQTTFQNTDTNGLSNLWLTPHTANALNTTAPYRHTSYTTTHIDKFTAQNRQSKHLIFNVTHPTSSSFTTDHTWIWLDPWSRGRPKYLSNGHTTLSPSSHSRALMHLCM